MKLTLNPSFCYSKSAEKHIFTSESVIYSINVEEIAIALLNGLEKGIIISEVPFEYLPQIKSLLENDIIIIEQQNFESLKPNIKNNSSVLFLKLFNSDRKQALEKLRFNQRICILGLGGIGTVIFENLLRAGYTNFYLIDNDVVHESNLNRQICYTAEQINMLKTEAIIEYGKKIDPNLNVTNFNVIIKTNTDLESLNLPQLDLFIQCADSNINKLNQICNSYCFENNTPFFSAACGYTKGYWGPLIDYTLSHTYHLIESKHEKDFMKSFNFDFSNLTPAHSFGPTNMIIGSQAAYDLSLFLLGIKSIRSLNKKCIQDIQNSVIQYEEIG